MRTALGPGAVEDLVAVVEAALDAHAARRRRGAWSGRQPVHTVYVPADRVDGGTVAAWGREAVHLLDAHAPDPADLAGAVGIDPAIAGQVRDRVAAKLSSEPVEDLRIDFEDGYGVRDDAEEDAHAARAAGIAGAQDAPAFVGLRVKSFAEGHHRRAMRTLDGFVTGVLDTTGGTLPDGLVVTFPKVIAVAHVEAFAGLLGRLEEALGLPERRLVFEIQIETLESVVGHAGRVALPALVDAAGGRLVGAHFGVFDYTAACGLPGDQQRLDHPACDFARHVMQVTLAGTGIRLSDGSTNRAPTGDAGEAVHAVWAHHAGLVRHGLIHGFYQGWDMHPSHLVSRFATVHAFHLAHLDDTIARLAATRDGAAGGGDGGGVDEPATIRALLASLRRAVDCGAIDAASAHTAAGVDPHAGDRSHRIAPRVSPDRPTRGGR
jgi:citrate lyase beta subunit